MPTATARHILVQTLNEIEQIKQAIADGKDFASLAAGHSRCPSGLSSGGELGTFRPGQMVKPFNDVCFNGALNELHTVQTNFGWHLVEVTARTE